MYYFLTYGEIVNENNYIPLIEIMMEKNQIFLRYTFIGFNAYINLEEKTDNGKVYNYELVN